MTSATKVKLWCKLWCNETPTRPPTDFLLLWLLCRASPMTILHSASKEESTLSKCYTSTLDHTKRRDKEGGGECRRGAWGVENVNYNGAVGALCNAPTPAHPWETSICATIFCMDTPYMNIDGALHQVSVLGFYPTGPVWLIALLDQDLSEQFFFFSFFQHIYFHIFISELFSLFYLLLLVQWMGTGNMPHSTKLCRHVSSHGIWPSMKEWKSIFRQYLFKSTFFR